MRWIVNAERLSVNRLQPEKVIQALKTIARVAQRNSKLAFKGKLISVSRPKLKLSPSGDEGFLYRGQIELVTTNEDIHKAEKDYEYVVRQLNRKAETKDWKIVEYDNIKQKEILGAGPIVIERNFKPPALTLDVYDKFFSGIYEREAHIRWIHDVLANFIETNCKPGHILLYGDVSAAKTTLLERIKGWYEANSESDSEIISILDGPQCTKAGFENWLIDNYQAGTMPYAVIIEEIEKQNLDNFLPLLSVMESCRLRKLNAKTQFDQEIRLCVLATCNDEQKIMGHKKGALWSRFNNKIPCDKPSRDIVRKVLLDKVNERGGKVEWTDAILKFVYDEYPKVMGGSFYGHGDLREILGLLDRRDNLLDGTAQRDILSIMKKKKRSSVYD